MYADCGLSISLRTAAARFPLVDATVSVIKVN